MVLGRVVSGGIKVRLSACGPASELNLYSGGNEEG